MMTQPKVLILTPVKDARKYLARYFENLERLAYPSDQLLVRADIHRDGLIFPPFLYGRESPLARPGRGELETEGLGMMARDMGHQCWGMPALEIIHARE